MAKVSVIVPVYKVEKYLKECVDSIINQTFKDIEVILVDERLTTTQVTRVMIDADLSRKKRKAQVDKLAAVVILQSYLDSKK